MRHPFWWILGLVLGIGLAQAAEQPLLEVHRSTDRSAIWVGDRFRYVVRVQHDPRVRFVTDNLQEGTLNLEPFEVISLEYRQRPAARGWRTLEIDLVLTTYEPEPRQLEIPSFNLFYFVESAVLSPDSDRPAETLIVPATPIALRSTLPEEVSSIRDAILPPAASFRRRAARPLAIGLLLLAIGLVAPVFFQGRRLQKVQEISRRRKQAQENLCSSLARLSARTVPADDQVLEFYEELNRSLREYLSAVSEVATEGKTGRDLAAVYSSKADLADGFPPEFFPEIPALLQTCEQVRYAPNGAFIGAERHGGVLESLRTLTAAN